MEKMVALNSKEQKRLVVLNSLERGEVNGKEAAVLLSLSLRHMRRLLAAYRKEGASALPHGNRGRKPPNALDGEVLKRVTELSRTKYAGFNTQHLTEMLGEYEGLRLSRSTVRRFLMESGVNQPRKRRSPRHRARRERYPQKGMLVQIDGSRHDWLEGRGERMSIVGAIDDASGEVLHALFRPQEDTEGYFRLLEGMVLGYGIPVAVYHDGHTIFEPPQNASDTIEAQLSGKKRLTQFGRLLDELGVTSIRSRSPQARGRVERLWGTFQDRLVSELRLAGAANIDEASEVLRKYLPVHNRKFAVPPAQSALAFSTPTPHWHESFCLKHERTVGLDNVVRFGSHRLQVLPNGRCSYARAKVEVRESFDGTLSIYYQGHCLDTRPAPPEAPKLRKPVRTPVRAQVPKPAPDHPWRRYAVRWSEDIGDKIAEQLG